MVILALDSTTAAGSVALAAGAGEVEVAAIDPAQPIATRLPADLIELLERRRVELSRVELFAVATGPGSFTGLRIGIATMQGLALAVGRPLLGVTSFEALASLARAPRTAVWIDAWRGEVYAALYECKDEREAPRPVGDAIVAPPDVVLDALGRRDDVVFVGDGAVRYRERLPQVIAPTPLLAGAVAVLARARAEAGDLPPPHAIRPVYVRRPDAELARDARATKDTLA